MSLWTASCGGVAGLVVAVAVPPSSFAWRNGEGGGVVRGVGGVGSSVLACDGGDPGEAAAERRVREDICSKRRLVCVETNDERRGGLLYDGGGIYFFSFSVEVSA